MALTTNLVSYWKLDESSGNAADSVGANTLTNTNTVTYGPALINNGADFGTANTNKKLAIGSFITGGNITIQAWVKLKTAISSGSYGIFEQEDDTAARIFNVTYNFNGGSPQVVADYHKNNTSDNNVTSTTTLSTSTFAQIVITYNGTTFTQYINAVSAGTPLTISGGGSGSVSGNNFTLGEAPRYSAYGSVIIDEVGVWSRALSGAEITQLYNGGVGLQYPFVGYTPTPDLRAACYAYA